MEIKQKYRNGVGVDVGTSNIVITRQTEDGTFVSKFHRDMLYQLDVSDEASDLLDRSDYLYVKTDNKYYIVGEDALRLVNAIGGGTLIRPMRSGILNPELKSSSELLFFIISALVKEPIVENECLRFSIPANPIDRQLDNRFHSMVLQGFFKKLGYDAKPINEAMAIGYDCNPIMKTKNEEIPLSGIMMSFGGGMINVALMFKGIEIHSFSVTSSGDQIDENVAKVTGLPISKVLKVKEQGLNLDNIDSTDRTQIALGIYYDEMLERVTKHVVDYFKDKKTDLEGEVQIIVAGGTSLPDGFTNRVKAAFDKHEKDVPFKVYEVKRSSTPFYSVVQGACIRALADTSRKQKD